jgi:hypothetical protein
VDVIAFDDVAAMLLAALRGDLDVLRKHAPLHATSEGYTVHRLHGALAGLVGGHDRARRLLLRKGATVDDADTSGVTALVHACMRWSRCACRPAAAARGTSERQKARWRPFHGCTRPLGAIRRGGGCMGATRTAATARSAASGSLRDASSIYEARQLDEAAPLPDMAECVCCNRRFRLDRLPRHEEACRRAAERQKKRKAYDQDIIQSCLFRYALHSGEVGSIATAAKDGWTSMGIADMKRSMELGSTCTSWPWASCACGPRG